MRALAISALFLCALLFQAPAVSQKLETAAAGSSGAAEGKEVLKKEPALTGDRHPLYRLRKSDVLEIHFTFAPDYDQSVTVLPDGNITLKGIGSVFAEGQTLPELTQTITQTYAFMREPELSITVKDFEKPFFIAGGQLGHPGKYELRSPTTVSQAIQLAGGFTEQSKHSQVVLFRKVRDGFVEAHVLNVKAMLASRNLDEDVELRADDMIYVPQNRISKIKKYLPVASLSTFFTPAQF